MQDVKPTFNSVYERDREYYKEYMRNYNKNRYYTDPEYRRRKLEAKRQRITVNCLKCDKRIHKSTLEEGDDPLCAYCKKHRS